MARQLQPDSEQIADNRRRTATDAEMLIDHASRGGARIDPDIMQQIFQWIKLVRSDQDIDVADDVAFRNAYQAVNAAVLPSNVYSIRERLNFDDGIKTGHLEIASAHSRRALIVILVLTLAVHCYFAVLQTLISDAQTAATDFTNAKVALASTNDPAGRSQEVAAEQLRAASCIWRSNLGFLGNWLFVDDIMRSFGLNGNSSAIDIQSSAVDPNKVAPPVLAACTMSVRTTDGDANRESLLGARLEAQDKLASDTAVLTRAISVRNAISQFLLPLLYGWLGALAYGLRTFASELRSVTFSRATHIEQKMRIPLGILAGATAGLLIQPETLNYTGCHEHWNCLRSWILCRPFL